MRKSNNHVKALLLGLSPWMSTCQFTSAESDDNFAMVKRRGDISQNLFTRKLAEDDLVAVYDTEFT
eukprot:CAMPEP_0171444354 /NCGR_PEP_ID=MMETSP0881-20121228/33220_1 /TAXON_ID=67004 /ORGANISM="Thalassiosira weissflogii, Strain CCMP1336" /LENGTH=65 /DNA_ID=CAMNT_0011968043 /DNA_START=105 /DNA_END=298 /DNA_ORIENTATION=-